MRVIKKVLSYCLGLLLLAFGVTFSIKSNLGVSPTNSVPYVVSLLTGINQGLCTTMIFCTYILIQFLILRKEFKPINLLQVVFASLFGYFVSFSNHMLQFLASPDHYIIRLVFLCISIMLVAFGLLFYLAADIVPQPPEGICLAIYLKTGIEFHKIKVCFDTCVVAVAALISMIGFGRLLGVREGTLIAAVCIGKVYGILGKKYKKTIEDFIHNL